MSSGDNPQVKWGRIMAVKAEGKNKVWSQRTERQRRCRNPPIAKTHSSQVGVAEVVVKAMMATRAMANIFMMVKEEVEMVKMN